MRSWVHISLRLTLVIAGLVGVGALLVYLPGFASIFGIALSAAVLLAVIGTVVVGIALSIEIPPLGPIAEISILSKRAVGFGKIAFTLLAFFGNTALTWIIALSVTNQASTRTMPDILGELWNLFVMLIGPIAYAFWFWIAIDLSRAGKTRRLEAVDALADRVFRGLKGSRAETATRRTVRWVAGGPWWQMLLSFYVAPLVMIAAAGMLGGELIDARP